MKRVAIIGCGWFGLPMAKALIASGIEVVGSKTTTSGVAQLQAFGIDGQRLNLGEAEAVTQLHQILASVDALVVNIPPGLRRGKQDYLDKLAQVGAAVEQSAVNKVIYISSTGAYPQTQGWLTEADMVAAEAGSNSWMLQQAENLMQQLSSDERVVVTIRFAGLVGAGRNPGRFMAGRADLPNGSNLVNLVHLEDCIAAVTKVLLQQQHSDCFNVVSPAHVRKDQFYTAAAKTLGLPEPEFLPSDDGDGKVVIGDKICRALGFSYQYSDAKLLLA